MGSEVGVRGDSDEVVREIYESDYRALVSAARVLCDRPEDAEELVQEAFVRCCDAWRRRGTPDDPLGYVRVAVMNLARSRLRRRRFRRGVAIPVPDPVRSAEASAVARDDEARLVAALAGLPARQRECVVWRHLLGASVVETAAALGVTEGTVKTHTSRAMEALETVLGDELPGGAR